MNKQQEKKIQKAKKILAEGIKTDDCRKWDSLFENGYNNANSIICGLYYAAMKDEALKNDIRKNWRFIPAILYRALFMECV